MPEATERVSAEMVAPPRCGPGAKRRGDGCGCPPGGNRHISRRGDLSFTLLVKLISGSSLFVRSAFVIFYRACGRLRPKFSLGQSYSTVSSQFKVTRVDIIVRGLTNRCPNCGGRTLFKAGSLFAVNRACPACGFEIERANDEGFFLGSMSLNYGATLVGFLTPVMLLAYYKVIGTTTAIVLAGIGAMVFPAIFYRSSRSWWLMNYYIFFPHHLPANGGQGRAG